MEQLHNGFTLELSPGAFPLSTDSIALSGFIKLPKNAKVLDLGSGCGTLGLLLCAKDDGCTVTGVELDESAHAMALHNARTNAIAHRLSSICADVCSIHALFEAGSFSVCVSNPPYFTAGPKSLTAATARCEETLPLKTLFQAAARCLKYGGDFFLVHRPERLGELCYLGAQNQLEPKRLCLLRHKTDGPVSLILLHLRKGAKPGLSWEEEALFDPDGEPTQYYKLLYHI